jgi:hypothetical protein
MHEKTDKSPSSRMKRNGGRNWRSPQDPDIRPQAPDIRPLEHLLQQQQLGRPAIGPGHPAGPRTSGPRAPKIRRLHRTSGAPSQNLQKLNHVSPDIRPTAQTSGSSRAAGHPAPFPDIRTPPAHRAPRPARTSGPPARTSGPSRRPGHPARRPDIRPRLSAHSKGPMPMYPFAHLDYIYSSSLFLGLAK